MSEYQCYEFVALDRPLTSKQMAELRAISTRAEITPTRFWNEYQWGDLKADPEKLVERYFDAHVYFANWGTHRLLLRVPVARVDVKRLEAYFVSQVAVARKAGDHLILELQSDDEDPDYYEESQGSLAALAPLRTELMRGDLRVAYLAWLLAVDAGDVDDAETEPPVPPGLSELTAAQAAMVEFLRVDEDLVAAAAAASEEPDDERPALRKWVNALPLKAKDEWLRRAVDDPDLALGGELLRAFRAAERPVRAAKQRTVAELRAIAKERRHERERAESARAAKAKKAADAARNRHLDALGKRVEAAWTELETLVEKSAYDEALKLAIDLRDLAKRDGASPAFSASFEAMRKRRARRRGFFDRWKRENEPKRW
ncbi:MAG: hypothetical protein ACHREM_22290 [Polyangiales bacterium]